MRNSFGGPLKLLGSLRGEGELLWGASGSRPVTYAIDVYSQGSARTASGDVRGDLAVLVARAPANLRLRFSDGTESPVSLGDVEADTATVELLGPAPSP
ncbi:MAG TPA: hypothetical protein VFE13_15490 [Caulobacteraceae bacterium]|jgi:hypothetical protein|nr:hypothetical protein [Caulobacteraceae bacterium]